MSIEKNMIANRKLILIKAWGGIHFPDIHKYNLASLLRHGIDWVKRLEFYSHLCLEADLASPWSIT